MPRSEARSRTAARSSAPEELKSLARLRQITLSVVGRKSGKWLSFPVWFVLEDGQIYLLPVYGSQTQWYKNLRKTPRVRISARGEEAELRAKLLTGAKQVASVRAKFRERYGADNIKKYYSILDVAVQVDIS